MIHYFTEVTIAWLIMYSIYAIFLKKETFFNINRWYLLHTLWIGAMIPFLREIPFHSVSNESIILEPIILFNYGTHIIAESVTTHSKISIFDFQFFLEIFYLLGVMLFALKMSIGLLKIRKIYKKGVKKKIDDFILVVSKDFHLPFSFFNKVFIHESFLENESIKDVINHELSHVNSRHSYDIIFIELMSVIFWWNPMIYLYKRSIRQTHEYVADAYAAQYSHIKNYGRILLGQSSSGIELALSNQFFNSHLKKRFAMLYKEKSANYKLSKYLLILPILVTLSILYSFDTEEIEVLENLTFYSPSVMTSCDSVPLDMNVIGLTGNTLHVGESYKFQVQNFELDPIMTLSLDPALGGVSIENLEPDCADGIMEFGFTPERPTKKDSFMIIEFKTAIFSVKKEFKVLEKAHEDAVDMTKTKTLYFHNNSPINIDKFFGKNILVDNGHIEIYKDPEDIKQKFNIEIGDNTRVVNFIGDINIEIDGEQAKINEERNYSLQNVDDAITNAKETQVASESNKLRSTNAINKDQQEVYKIVQDMPRFKGCEGMDLDTNELKACSELALVKYLYEHLKYPEAAKENNITGTVFIQFIVYKDGSVGDSRIVRDIGGGCGEAALTVVRNMPKWIPGKHRGEFVNVLFTLPARFQKENFLKFGDKDLGLKLEDGLTNKIPINDDHAERSSSSNATLKILANPSRNNKVKFNYESALDGEVTIYISDVLGNSISKKTYNKTSTSLLESISTNNFDFGIYILTVAQKDKKISKKFVIE